MLSSSLCGIWKYTIWLAIVMIRVRFFANTCIEKFDVQIKIVLFHLDIANN